MDIMVLVVLLSVIVAFICVTVTLVYYFKYTTIKDSYIDYRLAHSKFITLYIETARQNRQLVTDLHKFKHALTDGYFKPLGLNLEEVVEWYKKYDLKQGYHYDGPSSKEGVEAFVKIAQNETKRFNEIINNS